MPPRSPLDTLPDAVKTELNERLIKNGFSGYVDLADWLTAQGFQIGKSAVHRYGKELQDTLAETMIEARLVVETSKAMGSLSNDEKASMMEAGEIMAVHQIFRVFNDIKEIPVDKKANIVPKLSRAIADLNRSAIGSAKWRRDFEAEAERKANEKAAQAATSAAKAEGVSEGGIARIRAALGMVA